MKQLEGKVAIVTGASGGMGQAICRLFLAEGARLMMTDLRAAASGLAEGLSVNALFAEHDVTDEAQWQRAVNMAVERFGGVDILVNNAGWFDPLPMAQTSAEALHRHMSINALGVMLGMQSVVAPMRDRQGGSVVNICSTSAYKGSPGQFAYTASKWAVRGMTRAAAIELGPDGIRVNGIFPGLIDTPMVAGIQGKQRADILAKVPLGRIGHPDDVAGAALYLSSSLSAWVSGAELVVSGAYAT